MAGVRTGDDCWTWTRAKNRNGYGYFSFRGSARLAHRFAYVAFVGPLAADELVCHRCDNPSCVRPDHLYAGSDLDNMRDAKERGLTASGERNAWATIPSAMRTRRHAPPTPAPVVREIRRLSAEGRRTTDLARDFGLSVSAVSRIVRGERREEEVA